MLVGPDSPLRGLPSDLSWSQAMFLDGIRYCLDMAGIAYVRLSDTLLESTEHDDGEIPPELFPLAFMDAWSQVDSGNRLRVLLEGMRGMKRTSEMKAFLKRLAPFKEMRNSVQHLPGDIQQFAETGEATWGSLAWVRLWGGADASTCVMVAGAPAKTTRPGVNPAGKNLSRLVDAIELTAYGRTLSLSDAYDELVQFTPILERALSAAFPEDGPTRGADMLIRMDLRAGPPPEDAGAPPPSPGQ